MQKLGANPKSLQGFEEVSDVNFWEILSTETNRFVKQEIKKRRRRRKKNNIFYARKWMWNDHSFSLLNHIGRSYDNARTK